jgi:hypothetical protein
VLNPTLVIVGGEGAKFLDLLLPALRDALEAHCFDGLFADVELVVEPWGDDAWARGAAGLMLEEFFHPPEDREIHDAPPRRHGRPVRPASFALPPVDYARKTGEQHIDVERSES